MSIESEMQATHAKEVGLLLERQETDSMEIGALMRENADLRGRLTQDHGIVELLEKDLRETKEELDEVRKAGGPPFIRSQAIRNLREEVSRLGARVAALEAELQRLQGPDFARNTR